MSTEELEKALEQRDEEISTLEEKVEQLEDKVKSLQLANRMLKKENFDLGNILDDMVLNKNNPFTGDLGMQK